MTIPVINCKGEIIFNFGKGEKSSQIYERLVSLTIVSIDSDLLSSIDFDNLIDEFAATKTRKRIVKPVV